MAQTKKNLFPQCISYGDIIININPSMTKNYPKGGSPQKVCKKPMFYTEPPLYPPNEKKNIFLKFIYLIYVRYLYKAPTPIHYPTPHPYPSPNPPPL